MFKLKSILGKFSCLLDPVKTLKYFFLLFTSINYRNCTSIINRDTFIILGTVT